MAKKKRIYEVAKEYKISSNALLNILRKLKFTPKSHMSVATDNMLQAIQKKFEAEKEAVKKDIEQKKKPITAEKRKLEEPGQLEPKQLDVRLNKLASTLKKHERKKKKQEKRRKGKESRRVDHKAVIKSFKATMASMVGTKKGRKYKKRKPGEEDHALDERFVEVNEFMTVAELARSMDMKPAELIATCFKLGMMASINQRLDMDTIETLALECGFGIRVKEEIGE
ncbi:MAG: translation initiation factor IF-2 N-terminal domain-containing protein, partial [Candidatus Zixiibacteriota bacterium]